MMGFFIALLSGFSNAVGGIGCKVGENGGVRTIQTTAILGFFGVLFFGIRAGFYNEYAQAPWEVWALAFAVGLLQFLGMILLQKGFELGPLSLVWCAACLQFMPGLLFAHFVYGEPLTVSNLISLFLIFGAIGSASFGGNPTSEEKKKFSLLFGLVLTGMLLAYSSIGIALKAAYYTHGTLPLPELLGKIHSTGNITGVLQGTYSTHGPHSWLDLAPNLFMCVTYLVIAVCNSLKLSVQHAWCWNKYALYGGSMLSVGMLASFALQIAIMGLPGVIVFALSYSASILTTALISTFLMGEKRTAAWYCTLVCSLAAILLMLV